MARGQSGKLKLAGFIGPTDEDFLVSVLTRRSVAPGTGEPSEVCTTPDATAVEVSVARNLAVSTQNGVESGRGRARPAAGDCAA